MFKTAIIGASLIASMACLTAQAEAKPKRHLQVAYSGHHQEHAYRRSSVRVGGFGGPGTYAAAPPRAGRIHSKASMVVMAGVSRSGVVAVWCGSQTSRAHTTRTAFEVEMAALRRRSS